MEPMDTLKKPAMLARFRNRKGFSLIEMAIVLVIIGIIIGAIMKGQDLIANSQAKKAITTVNSWKVLTLAYLDRNGRLPGDAGKNSIIGDDATEQTKDTTTIAEIVKTMTSAPDNPMSIGSSSFWVYFGNTPGSSGTKNVMVVCPAAACDVAFTADQIEIMKAIDTALDGSAVAGAGSFRAAITAPTLITGALFSNISSGGGRANGVATPAAALNITAAGDDTAWSTADLAAVWSFDKPW